MGLTKGEDEWDGATRWAASKEAKSRLLSQATGQGVGAGAPTPQWMPQAQWQTQAQPWGGYEAAACKYFMGGRAGEKGEEGRRQRGRRETWEGEGELTAGDTTGYPAEGMVSHAEGTLRP